MPKPYRSRARLVLDILRATRSEGTAQVTRLLALANLTHPRLQEHLVELVGKGWLAEAEVEGRRAWRLTDLGRRALAQLETVDGAMQDFGMAL